MRSFSVENDQHLLTPAEFYDRLEDMNPGDPKNHWVLNPFVFQEPIWQDGLIITSPLTLPELEELAGPELTVIPLSLIDEDPIGYITDLVDAVGRISPG